MPDRAAQLVLDLPVEPRLGEEDFLVGPPNEEAVALLERWPDWPDSALVLVGPPRSGKSHLAAIWAERAGAARIRAPDLDAGSGAALRDEQAIVVEDLHDGVADEAALFHLLNRLRERGGSALVTGEDPPDVAGLRTPDLVSRLRRAPVARLHPPDDVLLRAVLVKLFGDRQLVPDTAVVAYLLARMERSFDAAAAIVADLDREALRLGRPVTRAVAADVLARRKAGEDREG